jgi:hypothetical protein
MTITVKQKHRLRRRLKNWRGSCPKDLMVVITSDHDVKYILKNTEQDDN